MFIEIDGLLINLDKVTVISRRKQAVNCSKYYSIIIDTIDNKRWELEYETEEKRDKKWEWLRGIVPKVKVGE